MINGNPARDLVESGHTFTTDSNLRSGCRIFPLKGKKEAKLHDRRLKLTDGQKH